MKKTLIITLILFASILTSQAQKVRPDALPWTPEETKATIEMATTTEQMAGWDRYPTYETYVAMMQKWEQQYPTLCRLDTIGYSVRGRLILCMRISPVATDNQSKPQFFYSSTIHGDEVTGYYFMLHLIDSLLSSYGHNNEITQLVDDVEIYINPLANPDGTYYAGNNTVQGSRRYNANNVDLNRNFPDPFGTPPTSSQQVENTQMINYVAQHHFILSANLHGGAEVMNYPWDSFTTSERPHPDADWWKAVGKRFVDTTRTYNSQRFRDVCSSGVIEGGDWYVIPNGRQDYMNQVHGCHEITMELSTTKTLGTNQLKSYWNAMSHSLINYIREIYNVPNANLSIQEPRSSIRLYPNPTHGMVHIDCEETLDPVLIDMHGRSIPVTGNSIDLSQYPVGIYLLRIGNQTAKIVKH